MDLSKSSQFSFAPNQNQTSNFFANKSTTTPSLNFGQTAPTSTPFGTGISSNTGTQSFFGGAQPTGSNINFGSQSQTGSTSLVQPSSTGFFLNKPSSNIAPSTTSSSLFGAGFSNPNPVSGGNLFPIQPTSLGPNTLLSQQPSYSNIPTYNTNVNNPYSNVFLISSSNMLKYDKVETLSEENKNLVIKIENEINNNDILLDYTSKTINDLYNEFSQIKKEGQKMLNCLKLIYTKYQKMNYIIEGLKTDVKTQNDFLDDNFKNYNILHNYPEMKINVPSQYFTKLAVEFGEKMSSFKKELSELEAIIELTYQNEIEEEDETSTDLVEKFIQEIYNSLRYFITECVLLNEKTKAIKTAFFNFMRVNYNEKESDLEFKYKQYMEKHFKNSAKI